MKTIQDVVDFARSYPALSAVLGNPMAGYGGSSPAINISNDIIAEILQKPFPFKWNRTASRPFVTNQYQQDYSTSITDLGWLENSTRCDVNSTTVPTPIGPLPVIRELMPTGAQGTLSGLSWVFNTQAICGRWSANTKFANPIGPNVSAPVQPLLQIRDVNGNIQVVTGWGTTGATEPTNWSAEPGMTTTDGTVTWTCIDPLGITWRITPLPTATGKVWQIQPFYQRKPVLIVSLEDEWSGIPDSEQRMVKSGFLAECFKQASDPRAEKEYLIFLSLIDKSVGADTREQEGYSMYPAGFGSQQSSSANTNVLPGTFSPSY